MGNAEFAISKALRALFEMTQFLRRALSSRMMEHRTVSREVKFKVPWGHIAGHEWGDPKGRHVLAIHGWQDNANSFEKLIPRLSSSLHVVAIDLPGHGQSSHKPPGSFYHVQDYIADVKRVIDEMKWKKFSFLSHSLGAGVSSWFSAALPEMVECLVLIEGFGYHTITLEDLPSRMGKALEGLSSLNTVDSKVYSSWETTVDRMLEGHKTMDRTFTREAAEALCTRGSKQLPDGSYQFTRDLRLKSPSLLRIPRCVNSAFTSVIKCPVLLIVAESTLLSSNVFNMLAKEELPKELKMVRVPGGHHVHLCQPEVLDKAVDSFLLHQTLHPDYTEISKL